MRMKMTNKAQGSRLEREVASILFNDGFYVHLLQQNSAGQPADIIAVRRGIAYLIDAKDCKGNRFAISRIEDNQRYAMRLWRERVITEPLFAIKMNGTIYMVKYLDIIRAEEDGNHTLIEPELMVIGEPIERWLGKW